MPFWDGPNPFGKKKPPVTLKLNKRRHKYDSVQAHLKNMLKGELLRVGDDANMREAVQLKEGVVLEEWLSMNVIEAHNTLLLIYGFICEDCTKETCPIMNAGNKYHYLWPNEKEGKAESLSAPVYIEKLFGWVASQIDDESVFATNGVYSKAFIPTVKKIVSRMFRVYAHIYYEHLDAIRSNNARQHLDKCFRLFYYFVDTFKLISEKELVPLQPLIDQLS
ncbi:MOB kinase activator-like 1 homolog C [Schistocerca gregaria]|uniref:MOB kinase activator-like 1 homolog C n=1 Tax=Schistocerca gregaria TaxID=7010 RepID=UPI00211F0DBE|nr:MOB kinase activator-like 1 homolog C [Schistocerca gregaria]